MADKMFDKENLLNDYALSKVPEEKRRSALATSFVWVGWCVSLSAFLTGGVIGGGTTAAAGLWAVLLGNLFLVVISSLIGLIGFKTGLSTYT
ncbi:cytosine permease, partial [Neobacillus niacini]